MGAGDKTLTFRPWRWSRKVATWLRRIEDMDAAKLHRHRRRYEQGKTWLWAGLNGRRLMMVMVMSEQEGPYGSELLCELMAGDLPHGDLTRAGAVAGEYVARQAGCSAVRFATARPGLARKTVLLGYELVEVQMRKALP